jgi:phage terminase large subunit
VSSLSVDIPAKLLPLFEPNRYKCLYGGRGSAKSWSVARALIALAAAKPVRVLCARETQKSIQESVHRLLKDQIDLMGLSDWFEVQETRILGKTGSDFSFAGIRQQGVANLKSFEGVDIVWVEEAQVVTKRSWDVLIPTIRKPGSEIWITFNPELDTDETYARFVTNPPDGAWVCKVNFDDNPWFSPELERERLDTLKRDPEGYRTIWLGECRAAVEGAIYAKQLAGLIEGGRYREVPYDPLLKVHTIWDLGNANNMRVVMAQKAASEIRVIDHIPGTGVTLADYVAELESRKYRWGFDFVPHDARAKQSHTGKSTEEMLRAMGRNPVVLPAKDVEEGIRAAGMALGRIYVDRGKCAEWMNSLKRYRRRLNESTGSYGSPLHDDASHDADTLRYLADAEAQMSNDQWGGPLKYSNKGIV